MKPDKLSREKELDFAHLWEKLDRTPPGPIIERSDREPDRPRNTGSR